MKEIKEFQGVKGIKEKKEEKEREKTNENKVLQELEAGLRFKNRFKDEGNQGTSTT
jgi:hypothetical protein